MIIGSTSMMESNPYASEKPQSLTDKMAESEERREFMQSRVAQQLHEAEIDPEIAFGLDAPPIGIDEMSYTDSTLMDDGNWYEASKTVHDYREKINAYDDRPADARDNTLYMLTGAYDRSGPSNADRKRAMAHDANEISEYGIEYAGYLTHNFTGSTIEFSKADEMPQEVALATAALLEMYDRTPDVSWPGTFRFFKNFAIDPPNAVGLGNLKVIGELIKAGGRGAIKKRLMQVALGSSAIGVEGSAYAAWYDYVQQRLRFQPPSDDELRDMDMPGEERTFQPDYDSIRQSAALGYALGTGLTVAVTQARPVVGAARDAFNRAVYGDYGGGAVLRSGIGPTNTRNFNREENAAFKAATERTETVVGKDGVEKQVVKVDRARRQLAKQRAAEIRSNFAIDDGWREIRVNSVKFDKDGAPVITWKQPSYGYNKPPEGLTEDEHARNLADKMIDDVARVVGRAVTGDRAARDIISQANWYRSMRTRLRAEFGGLADVFADLLGATSAQTGVEQNWNNSIEILRRFTRGEYDEEIKMYTDRLAAGETVNPTELAKLDKAGEFKLIRSAAGALFNTNSPAATGALLDMFRQVKQGAAPKTKNFTGNLIGYGRDATIDVWAARYLTDIAGLPRIPPPAEKAVTGGHRKGSTLENPQITGEFGFGQKVFEQAANDINASGVVKSFDPNLGDLGADDLQALVWFLEKEKWTKQGWTTKAGEGGSLDFEASLAGAADQAAIKEARRMATETFTRPARRKTETDEQYAMRVQDAESAAIAKQRNAEAVVDEMAAPLDRTVLGVARERPGQVPTNVQQAELAQELQAPVINDDSVVAFQTNNTVGEFAGETERALNAEYVTRSNFNPTALTQSLIDAGRKYDQDAVFISKVLREPTENSRPGVEIYFRSREDVSMAQEITQLLRRHGVDGFTFITDARQQDRAVVQASTDEATAGITGVRFQYIPEFDEAYDPGRHAEIIAEKEELYLRVIKDLLDVRTDYELLSDTTDIVQVDMHHYDTQVFKRPTGTDWINGGMTYDEYVGANVGKSDRANRRRQQDGSRAAPPDRSEE